jgi:nucleotide-binding universal stress UspA family protein
MDGVWGVPRQISFPPFLARKGARGMVEGVFQHPASVRQLIGYIIGVRAQSGEEFCMKILVPLDGSTFSEAVLGPVVQMAEAVNAEVHLLTVLEEPGIRSTWIEALARADMSTWEFGVRTLPLPPVPQHSGSGGDTESKEQTQERVLRTSGEYMAQIAGRFSSGRVKTKAIIGDDPVGAILAYSLEQGVDLIAMSTHGRSGLGRWVIGSVAYKLIHSTAIPLLLVRPRGDDKAPFEGKPLNTIVVPLDGSELAEMALAYGEGLARQMGLNISLIRVVSTPVMTYPGTEATAYDPKMLADIENAAAGYLQQKQTELGKKGLKIEYKVKVGNPAEHVIDFAEGHEGTLIVMSTHGRSGIARWILGSVADRILRESHGPILLIRSQAKTT